MGPGKIMTSLTNLPRMTLVIFIDISGMCFDTGQSQVERNCGDLARKALALARN